LYAFLHYQIKASVRALGFYWLIDTLQVGIEALPVNNFRCGMKLLQFADLLIYSGFLRILPALFSDHCLPFKRFGL